jgi:1-acyl-sn-glycerol-3-phosphate acyltransferase
MKAALRGIAFGVLAFVLTGLGWWVAFLAIGLSPRRKRFSHAVERVWAKSILAAAGARVVVTGAGRFAPREPRVLVPNHSSYLDIPAMLAAFPGPLGIVAKQALLRTPFIGWHLALAGHFFLDRSDPRQALSLMERAARHMRRDGVSALLFAEGTRSPDGRLAPLKPGSFFLPLTAEVPVQPVAIVGSHALMPKGALGPRRGGTIEVRVGAPIPTAGRAGAPARKALASEVHAALLALGASTEA